MTFNVKNLAEVNELVARLKLIDSITIAEGTRTVFGLAPEGRLDDSTSSFYDLTNDEAIAVCGMIRQNVLNRLQALDVFVEREARSA